MSQHEVDLDGLAPIPESARPMGPKSFVLVMWSTAIIIQVMAIGTFLLQDGLNLNQVLLVGALSAVLVALMAALNSFPGLKHGVPFVVQLRSSFGYHGARVAYFFRIVPAIAWYGIGTWIGAMSINAIMTTIFSLPDLNFVYFGLLTVVQILLTLKGITSIQWFDAIVAIIIFVMLAYFLVVIFVNGEMDFTPYQGTPGSWGLLFWGGVSAATANWATVMLNHSDLMRHVKPATGKTTFLSNFIGISPPWMVMVLFGMLIFVGTGDDDPIAGLVSLAPNPVFGVILLVFIVLAQISSNLTTSVLPAGLAFQDLFKVKWSTGVIIAGALSGITAPWVLFTSDWFFTFQNIYSVFLGPMLGVLLADYWFVQRRRTDVTALYDTAAGPYRYFHGFGPSAWISLVVGGAVALWQLEIAWLIGMPVGLIVYVLLKRAGVDRRLSSRQSAQAATPAADITR